jgi:DNA-binding transcriptional ArsR family regulator
MSHIIMNERTLEKYLKALANRRRLAMMAYLKRNGEANVGGIASEMGLSLRATSRHLLILERVNILYRTQRSVEVFYGIQIKLEDFIREIVARL